MKKLLLAAILLVGNTAYADSLTFTGSTANGEYGPYSMSLNGTPTQMICFSASNWITSGETWNVQAYDISQVGSITGEFAGNTSQYNELGYLANELFADPGNSDLQVAIWSVLGLPDPFGPTSGSAAYLQGAVNAVVNGGYVTTDLFYIPTGNNLPKVNGTTPQPFIQMPEPSSLVLLGTGLVGLIGLSLKK